MNWLKRLFCLHRGGLSFVRNIYGDEIYEWGFKRSLWRCKRCGAAVPMDMLNVPPASTASDEGEPPCCQADRDGDCTHKSCPQLRDGEPRRSGRHCPLDRSGDDDA